MTRSAVLAVALVFGLSANATFLATPWSSASWLFLGGDVAWVALLVAVAARRTGVRAAATALAFGAALGCGVVAARQGVPWFGGVPWWMSAAFAAPDVAWTALPLAAATTAAVTVPERLPTSFRALGAGTATVFALVPFAAWAALVVKFFAEAPDTSLGPIVPVVPVALALVALLFLPAVAATSRRTSRPAP